MAQVKIPAEFQLQRTLLADIIRKNDDPDIESPLADWLLENNIDLKADDAAGNEAADREKDRAKQEAASKTAFNTRDTQFTPVFTFIRGAAQVLKRFYTQHPATLADWGLPITDSGRIAYPASFEDRNALAISFFEKLASFGTGNNPLSVFIKNEKADAGKLSKDNMDAAKNNTAANAAARAAENATEQRDLLWEEPLKHIHLVADYLKSVYASNPKALGEWGFVVDEGNRRAVLRTSKLGLAETRTVTGVALNSVLTNIGKVAIMVSKGKKISDITTTLKPGEKMGIVKGYSTITVQNTSSLEIAEYTLEIQE